MVRAKPNADHAGDTRLAAAPAAKAREIPEHATVRAAALAAAPREIRSHSRHAPQGESGIMRLTDSDSVSLGCRFDSNMAH